MGLWEGYLGLLGDMGEAERRWMTTERDARAQQAQDLMGNAVTTEGTMSSVEFDEMGNPIDPRQSTSMRREGTGYLGSDRTALDQSNLYRGMLDAGYSNPEIQGMLGSMTPELDKGTALMQNFKAFQQQNPNAINPATNAPYTLNDFRSGGGPTINVNTAQPMTPATLWTEEEKAEGGFKPGAIVTTDPKTGIPKVIQSDKYSDAQNVSGGYALRMKEANDELERIAFESPEFDPTSWNQAWTSGLGSLDAFGTGILSTPAKWVQDLATSPEGKQYRQAQDNWLSANLRKESGAVLGKKEIEDERAKYFPAFDDPIEVQEQKARARAQAEQAMQNSSGGAYGEMKQQLDIAKEAAPEGSPLRTPDPKGTNPNAKPPGMVMEQSGGWLGSLFGPQGVREVQGPSPLLPGSPADRVDKQIERTVNRRGRAR